MKKVIGSIMLVFLIVLSLIGCSAQSQAPAAAGQQSDTPSSESAASGDTDSGNSARNMNVVVLLSSNLGSQSLVDVLERGCRKAADEFGFTYSYVENVEVATGEDTTRAVIAEGANFIIAQGAIYDELLEKIAPEYPDVKFVGIDFGGTVTVPSPNLYTITYKEHEAAFLNGVFCALMSESGKVAQLQGSDGGPMVRFNAGFRAGVQYVLGEDPTTVVIGFGDVNKGYETATMLFDQGYDWLACCAGASNLGVFQASEEKSGNRWVCGAADGQFHMMPNRIVASQVKTIDVIAYDLLRDAVNGTFYGGRSDVKGVAENGVDLIFNDINEELLEMIPQEVYDTLDNAREKMATGELQVPANPEELAAFSASV